MERKLEQDALQKVKNRRLKRFWMRFVSMLMCVVVFCTTYALILPAITKETETFCEIEAHIHTAACYPQMGDLICAYADVEGHIHSEECMSPEDALICELEETEGHYHSEACGLQQELICTLKEAEGHIHSDGCSVTETKLICTLAEADGHTHGGSCYTQELTCDLNEDENHTHDDSCYTEQLSCIMEETAGHTHDGSCYSEVVTNVCGLAEDAGHRHTDACYGAVAYGCGLEEAEGHVHDEYCYDVAFICGEEAVLDHIHTEECRATESSLICPLEEDGTHVHSEECYNCPPRCGQEAHEHTKMCYSNPNADLEDASVWEATLPGNRTGVLTEDVLAIAKSQLGYTESEKNYQVDEETEEVRGYTRYGAWYGYPYGDWCAMFASFCLRYAGAADYPIEASCINWVEALRERGLFEVPSEYIPKAGDLIFFDRDQDGVTDHVGFVEEPEGTEITTIEGNFENRVDRQRYELLDSRIVGYGVLPLIELPEEEETGAEIVEEESTAHTGGFVPGSAATADLVGPDGEAVELVQENLQVQPTASVFSRMAPGGEGVITLMDDSSTDEHPEITLRPDGTIDLTPYINSVEMYDSDDNEIPSGSTVTEGDLIKFVIDYTILGQHLGYMNGTNVTVNSNTLTYNLPNTFKVIMNDSGSIKNKAKQVVGSYTINSETNQIVMVFNDDFVAQNATGKQIEGDIAFFSTVVKVTDENGEEQNFHFKDSIDLGIKIEEKEEAVGDLTIEKAKTSIDGEEITYVVTVNSKEGTNGSITITDTMSKGLTFKEGIGVYKDKTNVNATFTPSQDKSSFTLTLPEMKPGETYTVRYKCQADIGLLDADMTVHNTAKVTGKDSLNVPLEDEVTVDHNFELLEKTGVNNEDGTITWTITVNQAKADISGWILEDMLRNGSEEEAYTGPVDIIGSNGNVVANNVRLPYTFPNGSADTYTIVYTTSQEQGTYNAAILKDDDTEIYELTGVVIGSPFTKTGEAGTPIQDEEGNYLLPITWTVTIDTTKAAIPGGYFQDIMEGYVYSYADDMYMTYDQLMAAVANIDAELVRVSGKQVEGVTAWVYKPGTEASGEYYTYTQLEREYNDCHLKKYDRFAIMLSDAGIPKGHTVNFSYQAYGLFPNKIVSTSTFVNRFSLAGQYEVEVPVEFLAGDVVATKHAMSYYDPDNHYSKDWQFDGTEGTAWYSYERLHDGYLAWAIELKVTPPYTGKGDVVLYEDLPDGVSVKGLDLNFLSATPTDRLQMRDLAPGKTDYWEFLVYSRNEYGHPTGKGQLTTIVVEVTEDGDLVITFPGIVFQSMADRMMADGASEWWSYLYIYTQIDEDYEWTPSSEAANVYLDSFKNQFTLEDEHGRVIDIGSQTQVIRKDESKGVIRKKAVTDEDTITYSVLLNTYGRDLIANANSLTVHDELTYTSTAAKPLRLRLVPGSVKLYEARVKSDGTYTKGNEVQVNYHYNEASSEQGGTTTWVHTIDLTVPDDKSLVLEYTYGVNGVKDESYDVLNTCTIEGADQGSLEGDTEVEIVVKETVANADTVGVLLFKVDAESDGIFLDKAKFNIYIWNPQSQSYIIVHHVKNSENEFVTDSNGMIVLDGSTMQEFAYNTAYYIVEKESPHGYFLSPEPYYFCIANDLYDEKTLVAPDNFFTECDGHVLTSGDIIYRQNLSDTTEITVEKNWLDYDGDPTTVTGSKVPSVTIELWQMLVDQPNTAKRYDTYTITPDESGNWSLTITGLPKATKREDGTRGTSYLYYVKEVAVGGYALESTENNNGINTGVIKLVNREQEGYILPETGGPGTQVYTMAGLLLIMISVPYLMYSNIHRRRERRKSS